MKQVLWLDNLRVTAALYTPDKDYCIDVKNNLAGGLYNLRNQKYEGIILNPKIPFMTTTDIPDLVEIETNRTIKELQGWKRRNKEQWWRIAAYFIQKVKEGPNRNTPIIGFISYRREEEADFRQEELRSAGMQDYIISNGNPRADLERILKLF